MNNSVLITKTSNSRHFSILVTASILHSFCTRRKPVVAAMAAVIAQMTRNNRLRKAKKVKTYI